MNSKFAVVGRRVPLIDARDKVTGATSYVTDLYLPGMLHGRILGSPHPHAKIMKIDTSAAEKLDGVKGVLTYRNVPAVAYDPCLTPPPFVGAGITQEFVKDRRILDSEVRFVGDPVAAVAAVEEHIAERALALIDVQYEELTAVFDPEQAMNSKLCVIHSHATDNVASDVSYEIGDTRKAFEQADHIFEHKYKTAGQQHCSMEPHACVCKYASSGRLTVWASSQSMFFLRERLSEAIGIPTDKIRVIQPHIGGGFGGKLDLMLEPVCALLAKKTGRPVKIVNTRSEEFTSTTRRAPASIELATAVSKEGLLLARTAKVLLNSGGYASHSPAVVGYMGWVFGSLYKTPNLKYEGYAVYTNSVPGGSMRGFGNPDIQFAVESQIDEISEELQIDPMDLRLRNIVESGYKNPLTGLPIESCGLRDCIERGAESIGWRRRHKLSTETSGATTRRGIGMACVTHNTSARCALPDFSSAFVRVNEDGTVNVLSGCIDLGQGSSTVIAQIVAEEIGVDVGKVIFAESDTSTCPMDTGTYASRVTYVGGNAARLGAHDAREQLLRRAGEMLKSDPSTLEASQGKIYIKRKPENAVSIQEVVRFSQYGKDPAAILGRGTFSPQGNAPSFGAQFAEVEVDVETGKLTILRIVAAHDVGRAINPMAIEGQVEGAVQQGCGYATTEQFIEDNGRILNDGFVDYKTFCAPDMPEVSTIIVESDEPTGPYGAKGVAEQVMAGIAPAIANAIYNALGVRIRELPLSPEKILKSMRRASH